MQPALPEYVKGSVSPDFAAALREQRARRLAGVQALRRWMRQYPELFGTQVHLDCFLTIGVLTTHSDRIPSLSSLYRSLPYAENSVRTYVRSLAIGGWINFVREPGADRRSMGLRVAPPLARVFDEYFAQLEGIGSATSPEVISATAPADIANDVSFGNAYRISA